MKTVLAGAVAVVCLSAAALADPVVGIWQTEPDGEGYAHVEIAPCGAAFCGHIRRTFNAEGEGDSPLLGRQIVIDMVPVGGGEYEGQVWRPSNDRIYIGRMTLTGDQLRLRGCVAGGLICSGQDWVRVQ